MAGLDAYDTHHRHLRPMRSLTIARTLEQPTRTMVWHILHAFSHS